MQGECPIRSLLKGLSLVPKNWVHGSWLLVAVVRVSGNLMIIGYLALRVVWIYRVLAFREGVPLDPIEELNGDRLGCSMQYKGAPRVSFKGLREL